MKHNALLASATSQDIQLAQKLISDGWYQVSRKAREVAQLPKDPRIAMRQIVGDEEMDDYWDSCSDRDVASQYLRVYASKRALTKVQFDLFRLFGGRAA